MERTATKDLLLLRLGIFIPIIYFGIQVAAAPFYPNYNFFSFDASSLGSGGSRFPFVFNGGSILLGIVILLVAPAYWRGLQRIQVPSILAALTALALVAIGLGAIHAGIFPLPHERHTGAMAGFLTIGVILMPFLLVATSWHLKDAHRFRLYLIINLLALCMLIPIVSGLIQRWSYMMEVDITGYQYFLNTHHGLIQRLLGLIVFVPIGVSAYFLSRRLRK